MFRLAKYGVNLQDWNGVLSCNHRKVIQNTVCFFLPLTRRRNANYIVHGNTLKRNLAHRNLLLERWWNKLRKHSLTFKDILRFAEYGTCRNKYPFICEIWLCSNGSALILQLKGGLSKQLHRCSRSVLILHLKCSSSFWSNSRPV